MRYLITGGLGFVGSNLASRLLEEGKEVCILDNMHRTGSANNLRWLTERWKEMTFHHVDVRNSSEVDRVIAAWKPDRLFHLAAQVAMTTSIENPQLDFNTNALGTLNILESMRHNAPGCHIIYASTNKVYGDLKGLRTEESETRYVLPEKPQGLDVDVPLDFQSPYGCSKGAADQYVLDYHRVYGLNTTVFRHSTIYGDRQFATYDQGWMGWFCQKALEQKSGDCESFTISGDGKQVRDVLYVEDCVRCYLLASESPERTVGKAYNIGGGPENSLSILELFDLLQTRLDVKLIYEKKPWRLSDQRIFISRIARAKEDFGWEPTMEASRGVDRMLQWIQNMPERDKR